MAKYILSANDVEFGRRATVGTKAASIKAIIDAGLPVPRGFALTTDAFQTFLGYNNLQNLFLSQNNSCLTPDKSMSEVFNGKLPPQVEDEVSTALADLGRSRHFAVRSSCTLEDLDGASFAGIYQTVMNVPPESLVDSILKCYASLYSARSLTYMSEHKSSLHGPSMGVLIQEMINAVAAGTIFTADATSGFSGVHVIESVWGFGEGLVSGRIVPNSWVVFKPTGQIISRELGNIREMHIAAPAGGLTRVDIQDAQRQSWCLTDAEVMSLGRSATALERSEGSPLDIEWAKDENGDLLFLQMRPLSIRRGSFFHSYSLNETPAAKPILRGIAVTQKIVHGHVTISPSERTTLGSDQILVVPYLDVDWLPYINDIGGIISEGGGHTSHAAIILRERETPSLFGAQGACTSLTDGQAVTLECSGHEGLVWDGTLPFSAATVDVQTIPKPRHAVYVVTSDVTHLHEHLKLPVSGVGLVRLEFIIHEAIGIHPMALIDYDGGVSQPCDLRAAIDRKTRGFSSKREYYIRKLTEGICSMACRCPNQVVNVRAPDFIGGDYLSLLGGQQYETNAEPNPMIGWRGTSRLIDKQYAAAFELDCEAFRRAIDDYGFDNIHILVPFCRTPADAIAIRNIIRDKGPAHPKVGMMVEIPSNIMLARQFVEIFDFFLIGPMDLTQLTYGADRTNRRLSQYCNETAAVREMVKYFLALIAEYDRDVFIGGWPLFQYLAEYSVVKGRNRIHMVELPDRLREALDQLRMLEESLA